MRFADHGVNGDATELHRRRQRSDLELNGLQGLGARCIDGAHGDRVGTGGQVGGVQGEIDSVACDERANFGINTEADDRRLTLDGDAAGEDVAHNRFRRQPFNLQAWRQRFHLKGFVDRRGLSAGVGGADAQRVFFGRQFEWIQVEFERRLAIGMHHVAIDDEFDLRDLGLSAGFNRNHFRFGDIFLRRCLKVVGYRWRQGGDLKLGAQPADIAFDIAHRDIQLMLARLFLDRLNGEGLLGGDDLAIEGDFNAFDLLVGADLDGDLRIFGQRLGEEIIGQEEQGHRNRRAQRGLVRRTLPIGRCHIQSEIITRAIGWHIGAHRDDVLAAEEKSQVAVDLPQFLRLGRLIEFAIGFCRDRFQKAAVNVPAQADGINRHAMNGRGADALLAAVLADVAVLAAIGKDHDCFAVQRRLIGDFNGAQRGVIERRLSAISQVLELSENQRAVGRVIDHQAHTIVKGNQGDRVIGTEGVQVIARGRQRVRQGLVGHAAAGINDQDAGESKLVIGDVLHARDRCQARQIAAHREVVHIQARDQLAAGIQNAGVNSDFRKLGGIDADDIEADAGFILQEGNMEGQQQT